ncbi:hypothetical protein DL96DRAFT_1501389 [Flagelloscypha sp. PMI_526]|nr:hypothetical protein DL96DRAFT_1501389 [Flagelloscypha sp. PMI_526]
MIFSAFWVTTSVVLASCVKATTNVSFPLPTGPYYVGQTQRIVNHTTPNDPVANPPNSTGTFFLVTFYYPTSQVPPQNNQTQPYLDETNVELWGGPLQFPNGTLSNLTTNIQWQAYPLKKSTGKPTLIFSPGGGEGTVEYTALLTDLASNGYVVAAIEHPGEQPYLPFLHTNPPSGVFGLPITYQFTDSDIHQIYQYRMSDMEALLSQFPKLVKSFGASFNTTHFGLFGHSIGGAASAGVLARNLAKPNPKYNLLAGSNMDGSYFDFYGSDFPNLSPTPFFQFGQIARTNASFDPIWSNFSLVQTGWFKTLLINGTTHQDFSDLPVWVDIFDLEGKTLTPIGPLKGERAVDIVKKYVGAFFDFVSGFGGEELFKGELAEYPEIVFVDEWSHDPSGGDKESKKRSWTVQV